MWREKQLFANLDFFRLEVAALGGGEFVTLGTGQSPVAGNLATLACHRLPDLSNVVIDETGQVLDVENPGTSRPDPSTTADKVAYTGIAVYSPEILAFLPSGVSHATVAWIAASKAGRRVRVMDVSGAYWTDVGNPATYARAVLDALREDGETVYLSAGARCGRVEVDGHVVVEAGSEVRDSARLRNCIVMPGATVSARHEDAIIGPDYVISLSESDMQPSLHAAARRRLPLTDPLFAGHFGIPTTHGGEATPLPFTVEQPTAASLPFERTQVVWVRTDLDRDGNGRPDFQAAGVHVRGGASDTRIHHAVIAANRVPGVRRVNGRRMHGCIEDDGQHHQSSAVRGGHEKRPSDQSGEADAHAVQSYGSAGSSPDCLDGRSFAARRYTSLLGASGHRGRGSDPDRPGNEGGRIRAGRERDRKPCPEARRSEDLRVDDAARGRRLAGYPGPA